MKKLGNTGIEVFELGMGGIPIQRVDIDQAKLALVEAVGSGINFIDTAAAYGKSEEYIGAALASNPHQVYIATKSMSRTYEGMKKDIQSSLDKLQRDYIDLYQIHNLGAGDYEQVISHDGALRALQEAKAEGKIKHIGITSHSVDLLKIAIETGYFETVQFPYNIVEYQGIEMFQRAKALGMGTIVMKPLAGGAILDTDLAIRYTLANDYTDVIIPGMADVEEINNNISSAQNRQPLSAEDWDKIKEIQEELGNKFCRRCGYCNPCTVGISINTQFILEGYLKRYGLADWAKERYESNPIKASDCIGCKECEPRCPYGLPISEMMKRVAENFETI